MEIIFNLMVVLIASLNAILNVNHVLVVFAINAMMVGI